MPKNEIVHVEWASTNLDRSEKFLSGLFGWTFVAIAESYRVSRSAGAAGVGIQKTDSVQPGQTPVVLIEVEEITPYLEKVVELGGRVVLSKTPIPNMGWFAHIADFDGNLFGLIQAPSAP
jgi:predicted enzyme related to lactoylglutathione lyase